MVVYNNPIVLQRADPWVLKVDGEYYFTASDPEYNCIAIRHASNINDLQKAPETVVWRKHESGPASIYIWPPNYTASMAHGISTSQAPQRISKHPACRRTACSCWRTPTTTRPPTIGWRRPDRHPGRLLRT